MSARQNRGGGAGPPAPPPRDNIRVSTLLLLDITVGAVAFLLLRALTLFLAVTDRPERFVELAAALALMTAGVMLMLLLSLNASFFRVMTRRRAAPLALLAWVAALSGVLLGVAMGGHTATKYAGYVVVAGLAFVFISTQDSRIAKAQAQAAAARQAGQGPAGTGPAAAGPPPAPPRPPQPHARSRQRRGGRKR